MSKVSKWETWIVDPLYSVMMKTMKLESNLNRKNIMRIIILLIIVICCFAPDQSFTQDKYESAGLKESEVRPFVELLKSVVEKQDKVKLSTLIHYPLRVYSDNEKNRKRLVINNPKQFLKHYDFIINKRVKDAILNQSVDDLFCNYQGVMIDNGEVWFNKTRDNDSLYIIAINN